MDQACLTMQVFFFSTQTLQCSNRPQHPSLRTQPLSPYCHQCNFTFWSSHLFTQALLRRIISKNYLTRWACKNQKWFDGKTFTPSGTLHIALHTNDLIRTILPIIWINLGPGHILGVTRPESFKSAIPIPSKINPLWWSGLFLCKLKF